LNPQTWVLKASTLPLDHRSRWTVCTELKKWPLSSETTAGQMNVAHSALGDKSKIYLPPLHIKRGLIEIYMGRMDKEREGFAYLR